jgi:hypothetical protein
MGIYEQFGQLCSGTGSDFRNLDEVQDRIEAFLRENLPIVLPDVPALDPEGRTRNERSLCADLWKMLNACAYDELFSFFNENPENERATRTIDAAVVPDHGLNGIIVGTRAIGPKESLYGIEAKRLPTPNDGSKIREREYIVGHWDDRGSKKKSISGGIERLKESHHSPTLFRSAIIAFVQEMDFSTWERRIKLWIDELVSHPIPSHKAKWAESDHLVSISSFENVAEFSSTHARDTGKEINLRHFWLKYWN